jgi:LacI family transcriptional regulator
MNKRATIYDVARIAGVSISTVSRVLNSPSLVNEKTRKAVLAAMESLDFVPKAEAIARARKHLNRVGVLTPFFTEASFVQRIRGISDAMLPSRYELIIYTVKSPEQLAEYLDMLPTANRLDGLIILSLSIPEDTRKRILQANLPTVFVETGFDDFSCVDINNRRGGWIAADFLLTKGYKTLGFVGEYSSMEFTLKATELRLDGFRDRLSETGIVLDDRFVRTGEFAEHSVERWIKELLEQDSRPQALFASSDIIAAKILKEAANQGIKVPQELGVLGFDDLDMAEYLHLSTVRQNLDASGRLAAELLQKHIETPGYPAQKVFLELSVIDRGSC